MSLAPEHEARAPAGDLRLYILAVRKRLGWSQSKMADRLGLHLRSYQDLEAGASPVRLAYAWAVEMLALMEAVERNDAALAGISGSATALAFSRVVGAD